VLERVRPHLRTVARILLVGLLLLPGAARAGEKEDAVILNGVEKILATDVAQANYGEARKKLRALLDKCRKGCSGPAVAHVYVAIGFVSAQIGQAEEAKTAWFDAFSVDPNAQLPSSGVSPAVRQQFDEVKKAWLAANPQPDDAQKAGWVNKQAFDLSKAAIAAEQAGNFGECVEKEKAALTLEENMRARMHLAYCEAKTNKIVDALRDNAKALELAKAKGDAVAQKQIGERVTELLPRLAHVKFEPPAEVTDLRVVFDGRPIPPNRVSDSFTIDPGKHTVHAEGVLRGARVSSDDTVDVKESETAVVKLALKPAALTEGQLQCMVAAKTQAEIAACLPSDRKPLVVHLGLDMSAYGDTVATTVLTPSVRAAVVSPTAGWNVGASYLVDVVSSASPDVVATASPRFRDVRHAATANGGYKPGRFGGSVFGSYSSEHDYVSRTIGGSVAGDFADKQVTPNVGYSYTWDTIGRAGTDYDVYSKPFDVHTIMAGSTFILSPLTLLVVGANVALENGDQSKPYRHVPLFEPGVNVPIGASADEVNKNRLVAKPLEQLPLDRQRFSLAGRFVSRVSGTATLRLEERLYQDTWAIRATTTDVRYLVDLSPRFRVWPHGHVHAQTGASFYQRIYGATLNSDGSATVPKYRTTDRELSPMLGFTAGGGARYALTAPSGTFQLALFSTADALYNYYINSLYIRSRLGVYGTIGLEADFE
jgi:Flp pilus assembly protein TadD